MSGRASSSPLRRFAPAAVGVVAVLALSGCGAAAPVESAAPVTLRMLHIDRSPGLDPSVSRFIEEVEDASSGAVTIELVSACCGEDADNERVLVSKVAAGEADLGLVATRAFGDLGVLDLRALTAPLLLDSYAVQGAVLASDFAVERLGALTELGVTGIGLVPGPIRVPLSRSEPLLAPADWEELTVHTHASSLSSEALAALGAEPVSLDWEGRDAGLFDGSIRATDNGFAFQRGDRERLLPYATVNVGLWPRVSAVLGNPEALARLSDAQRAVLTDAAAAVAGRASEFAEVDATLVGESCERGARYAEASDAQLAAMETAFEPVYAQLDRDPTTREFIERIREVKATVDAEPHVAIPDGCSGPSPFADTSEGDANSDASVVNGRWTRDAMTIDELVAGGLTPEQAQDVAAVFTLEFDDGAFTLHVDGEWVCDGEVTVTEDRLVVDYLPGGFCGPGGLLFEATFAIDGDTMTLSDVESQNDIDKIFFGLRPWILMG